MRKVDIAARIMAARRELQSIDLRGQTAGVRMTVHAAEARTAEAYDTAIAALVDAGVYPIAASCDTTDAEYLVRCDLVRAWRAAGVDVEMRTGLPRDSALLDDDTETAIA